ncbi:zinc finger and SCAN domain-containing protein 5B-like [Uloborus diversus]|uniref:zinc finger and SCAN domain-containing protein 5B-like n=1 Tax=Uloborus diversus TaxID=327109 RepID=UPI002409C148|nr:zinc finger and SCAN domain-containing protein 5B-like [Uloborus diversus]
MNEKQVNEKVFPCSECKENFPTSVLLKRHQVSCSKKKAEVSPKKRASPSDDVEEIVVKKKKIEEPVYDVEEGSDVDESSDVVVPNEKGNKKGILQAFMSSKVQSLLSSANAKSIQKDNSSAEKQDLTDKSAEKDKVSICASSLRKNIALSLQKNKSSESKSRNRKSDHCEASQPAVPVTSSLSEKDDDPDSSNSVQKKKRGRPSRRQPEEQNQSSDISANKQSKTEDPKSNALATTEKSSKQIEKQRKNEQPVKPSKKVNEEKTTENNADTVVKVHEEKQASKSAAKVVSKGRRGRRPLRKKDDKPNSVKSTSAKSSNDISQASSQDVEIDVPTSDANEIAVVDKQVNSKQASKSVDPSSGHNGPNIHFDESRNDIDDPPVVTNGSSDAANGSVEILTQSETTTSNNEDARAFMVDLLTDYSSLDTTAPAIKAEKPDPSEDPGALDRLPNQTIFTCAVCHKNFTRKFHLDRHLRISRCSGLPMPSFPCELCNRVYTRKDNLREHLRSHTGEVQRRKNHKCQFCDKAFHGQSLLAIHIRKHTGEKPFECDFCPKKFPSAGALSKHRLTHTGERPYSCNECGRSNSSALPLQGDVLKLQRMKENMFYDTIRP